MASPGKQSKSDPRKERLKAALRENLRRRKAQERGRAAGGGPAKPDSEGETAAADEAS
jgi:hypothetical protein